MSMIRIEEAINKLVGVSYNCGTFASIAYKYPDDFEKMRKDIRQAKIDLIRLIANEQ